MKTVLELLPLATGIAVVGALTWYLLDRNIGAGKWLLAGLLLFHGWVHVLFLFPQPDGATGAADGVAWPFDLTRSWLIRSGGLDATQVRTLGIVLIGLVVVGFVLASLSTVGVLVPAGWWTALVVGSALASAVLLVVALAPTLLLGFAIDGAVAWLALASIWSPLVTRVAPTS
jgi:hypothetical protein